MSQTGALQAAPPYVAGKSAARANKNKNKTAVEPALESESESESGLPTKPALVQRVLNIFADFTYIYHLRNMHQHMPKI